MFQRTQTTQDIPPVIQHAPKRIAISWQRVCASRIGLGEACVRRGQHKHMGDDRSGRQRDPHRAGTLQDAKAWLLMDAY